MRRDEDGARLAFAAARTVAPFGAFPSALLPPGHAARTLADAAFTEGAALPAARPRKGQLLFDGTTSSRRPADRPTVMQLVENDSVRFTVYLSPQDPLPESRLAWWAP